MAIRIPILTSFDPKGLKQANASFATLQNSIGSLSRNFAVAGVAIGAAGAFLGRAVNSASNLSESVNAVNVAFGSSSKAILALGENAADSLGLSKTEFNEAAVAFSSFAERIVGKGGDTSKFIQELTTRAADFASVYNLKGGVAEALERFRSGLAGQTEPLAKLGVNLLDSEV
jgi:ABC-type transporter Mla subunit MlaD